jgi:UDP-N-acetylmuramoyl-L-alanine---L-glutamate ligase
MIIDQISQLDKILILGFAREGQSTYNFLRSRFPHLQIDTLDQKDDPNYLNKLITGNWSLVIKSPGISPHLPEIETAKQNGIIFTSQTQLFFELCPTKNIIGVTGTKGKSTTASLIHQVLSENGISSHLVGNIGRPALDFISEIKPDDWVVIELSSYQLMDLTCSPHIAVLQKMYPDHLDYHLDFEEYKTAKLNITKYQTSDDYLITVDDYPTNARKIFIRPQFINSQLLGYHNLYNIQPAVVIGQILGLSNNPVLSSIKNFIPLDTRLTNVGTYRNITFYEDTLATIPEATIAAIEALQSFGVNSGVETLIAGGHDRKQNYLGLAKKILDSNIKTLILFPETGTRIEQEIINLSPKGVRCYHADSMSEAVQLALDHTASGKICLLSPAAPSFTLFKDYRDESAQYRQAIKDLTL